MSDQDPSSSLTTHLLAALNELQTVQQKTQRDLNAERANSRQLQKELDALHETIAQLREELRARQIATEDQPTNAPVQRSQHTTVRQTSSANDIASTSFSTDRKTAEATGLSTNILLESLYSGYGIWKRPGPRILFSSKGDHVRITHDEHLNRILFSFRLSDKDTRIFSCSRSVPTTVLIVKYAAIPFYLRFLTPDDCNTFLETARRVKDTSWLYDLEFNDYSRVFESTRPYLKPALAAIRDRLDQDSRDPVIQQIFKDFRRLQLHKDEDLPSTLGGASDQANNTSRLEPRTVDDCIDKISTQSNTDASKLSSNLDRLKREMTTLAEKHKSAMNEVNTRSSANSEDLNHIDGVYKSVEKDLMLKASSLEVEAAVLNDKIVQLTSHVIMANASLTKKSEDGRTQSNTESSWKKKERCPGHRRVKRKSTSRALLS
ncbi:hypothetical protein KCU64_g16968, partial [Aureobasidium melanogenum]